jgi:DUF1009 family protein
MLALITGRGGLPARVAAEQAAPPLVCALKGHVPTGLEVDLTFRLETIGTLLLALGERGVTEVCLCGAIDRPAIDPAALDIETKPLVPMLQQALAKGDDGALRVILDLFEKTGFTIRAAHELAPGIIARAGVMTQRGPGKGHERDALRGQETLAEMGAADLGQACVIRKGVVLARETGAGTDAMLEELALAYEKRSFDDPLEWALGEVGELTTAAIAWLRGIAGDLHEAPGAGAILVKGPKPGQDRRVDLPTIGPGSAMRAAEAGLDGIVIEAGGVIVLEPEAVVDILDAMGIFLWAREAT